MIFKLCKNIDQNQSYANFSTKIQARKPKKREILRKIELKMTEISDLRAYFQQKQPLSVSMPS